MRVKVLSRSSGDYLRETKHDIHKVERNYSPRAHPFETAREYGRALNAVKLERVFAKPFVGSLGGHSDVVHTIAKHPNRLSTVISGACDGVVKIWNIAERKCVQTIEAHNSIVRSICVPNESNSFYSVDDSMNIKLWNLNEGNGGHTDGQPVDTIIAKTHIMSMSHHRYKPLFITSGEKVDVWERSRTEPLCSYEWGVDSVHFVQFNPIEADICVASASDRSIILYDTRKSTPLRKVVLSMKSNSISWNPMEAYIFTAANEDNDLYTFDMRKLGVALQVHKDHVSAVLSVDYSPTGKEFVSGSYDKTIRIFPSDKGRSREVYHTKRMQRLTGVLWSLDSKYIISSSDEMDIRIWKSNASEKLGVKTFREVAAFRYQEKLKQKFGNHPEIKRIARHRHVPKHIYHSQQEKRLMIESLKRKQANRRAHSRPGTVPYSSERTKSIVQEED